MYDDNIEALLDPFGGSAKTVLSFCTYDWADAVDESAEWPCDPGHGPAECGLYWPEGKFDLAYWAAHPDEASGGSFWGRFWADKDWTVADLGLKGVVVSFGFGDIYAYEDPNEKWSVRCIR